MFVYTRGEKNIFSKLIPPRKQFNENYRCTAQLILE